MVSDKAVDLVFVLGTGSTVGDWELRIALRSWQLHFPQLGTIWLVGHCPDWIDPTQVRHIPFPDPYRRCKDANLIAKLLRVSFEADLSERFMFCSDDQFLLAPHALHDFRPWVRGELTAIELSPASTGYQKRLLATGQILASRKLPTMDFEGHVPYVMEKAKLHVFLQFAYGDGSGYTVSSLYHNANRIAGVPIREARRAGFFGKEFTQEDVEQRMNGARLCSIDGDAATCRPVVDAVNARFPTPSRYEADAPERRIDPELAGIVARLCQHLPAGRVMRVNLTGHGEFSVFRQHHGALVIDRAGDYTRGSDAPESQPKPWGPYKWAELHSAALDLPDPASRTAFIVRFGPSIPCGECRRHWEELIAKHPPALASKESFFAWSVFVHNIVNQHVRTKNGDTSKREWKLEEARRLWESRTRAVALPARIDTGEPGNPMIRTISDRVTVVLPERDPLSNPLRYYDTEHEVLTLEAASKEELRTLTGNVILAGWCLDPEDEKVSALLDAYPGRKLITWGVGRATPERPQKQMHASQYRTLGEIGLGVPFVPDPSCLYPFPETEPAEEVGCIDHPEAPIEIPVPSIRSDAPAVEIIAFISRFHGILTNCPRAAYWAGLMGRKVVAFPADPRDERFLRQQTPVYMGRRKAWKDGLRHATANPEILNTARRANDRFAATVGQLLGRSLSRNS